MRSCPSPSVQRDDTDEKSWELLKPDLGAVDRLVQSLDIDPLLARLLINRGLHEPDEVQRYLTPSFDDLHDPFLIPGMKTAISRLRRAFAKRERVLVFGDDDVDGITSTSVLYLFLKRLDVNAGYFIPRRKLHGHGLNLVAIKAAIERFPCDLLITTDCGTSSVVEIAWLKEQGIDTLVVDHHAIPDVLPDALSIVNPQLPGNLYPFPELAAVGVTFNLILGIFRDLEKLGIFDHHPAPDLHEYLDLVSLGTVADVVPLRDVNRVFVSLGLEVLRRRRRCGIAALLDRLTLNGQPITERTICYRLAPRLNAAGRVGDANECVELLTTDNYGIAQQLAKRLDEYNSQRQEAEAGILHEALEQAALQVEEGRNVLVISKDGWHQGVLGIVASRLLERFHRPTILIAITEGRARGSARSPNGVDILECIRRCHMHLENFGGHNSAAGLTLKGENVPALHHAIELAAIDLLGEEGLPTPTLTIDAELMLGDFEHPLVQEVERLAPFGAGNREPTFLVRRTRPLRTRIVGRNHLRLRLRGDRSVCDVIGFSMGSSSVRHGRLLDVILTPRTIDQKREDIELRMLAMQPYPFTR